MEEDNRFNSGTQGKKGGSPGEDQEEEILDDKTRLIREKLEFAMELYKGPLEETVKAEIG